MDAGTFRNARGAYGNRTSLTKSATGHVVSMPMVLELCILYGKDADVRNGGGKIDHFKRPPKVQSKESKARQEHKLERELSTLQQEIEALRQELQGEE